MTGHAFRSTATCISNSLEASGDNQLCRKFIPGDIAWTKINNNSWWPAQVVDEKSIGAKPKKKSKDEILVRLYGSHEYLYVDPLRCNMEFENILKQDNITVKDAFQKSLEEELSRTLSGGKSKRKVPHFRENTAAESPKGKLQKQEKTARNQKKVASPSLGSSHKQNEASSEQNEKDDARDKTASNTKSKQDEARRQRVNKKYSKQSSEGNNLRQGTPENQNIKETEIIGPSRVQSTKRDCLRRSLRNADKKHEMEKDKVEHSKCQDMECCRSGKLNMMDKVKSGASNIKEMKQLASGQLRQKDREQVKEKFLSEASKKESDKQVENGIPGDEATKPEIIKQYTFRNRKHNDVREEVRDKVRLEISKDKGKENHETGLPDSADTGVSGDLICTRIKLNGLQELNCKDAAEQSKQIVSNVVSRNKATKQGEAGKQNATKKTITGASKGKSMKQNGSRQQKHEDTKELLKTESPKSGRQVRCAAPQAAVEISARKIKVMQSLGLIAPSGSPFHRDGMLEAA